MVFVSMKMSLRDWWLDYHLYYILPNRIYFFLGAEEIDSEGEDEWYNLIILLHLNRREALA